MLLGHVRIFTKMVPVLDQKDEAAYPDAIISKRDDWVNEDHTFQLLKGVVGRIIKDTELTGITPGEQVLLAYALHEAGCRPKLWSPPPEEEIPF